MDMEARPMPRWLMKRYSSLWAKTRGKEFDFDLVVRTLKDDNKKMMSIVLSRLKKLGWLTLKLDPNESRKRVYQLKSPEEATLEIASKH